MDQVTESRTSARRPPLSTAALFYGVFLVLALVMVLVPLAGFGLGTSELALFWMLLVAWVSYWMYRRRGQAPAPGQPVD